MNYTGITFAEALQIAMNSAANTELHFEVLYDLNDNLITIKRLDKFNVNGSNWSSTLPKDRIQSMSVLLSIGKTSYEITGEAPYIAHIDLHTTRNLYLTSSSLASDINTSSF